MSDSHTADEPHNAACAFGADCGHATIIDKRELASLTTRLEEAEAERDRFAKLVDDAQRGRLPWRDDMGNDRGTPAGVAMVMERELGRLTEALRGAREALERAHKMSTDRLEHWRAVCEPYIKAGKAPPPYDMGCRAEAATILRLIEEFASTPGSAAAPNSRHVCCGCGGLCDSGEPCPMAYNCKCRAGTPPSGETPTTTEKPPR